MPAWSPQPPAPDVQPDPQAVEPAESEVTVVAVTEQQGDEWPIFSKRGQAASDPEAKQAVNRATPNVGKVRFMGRVPIGSEFALAVGGCDRSVLSLIAVAEKPTIDSWSNSGFGSSQRDADE